MHNSSINYITFVVPLLVAGLFLGFTTPLLCLIFIILLLLSTEKHTSGFFLLLFGGVIGGLFRSLYPSLPIYGSFLNLIGLILIGDMLLPLIRKQKNSILFLFIVFSIFFSTYLYAVHTNESSQKIINIVNNGILFFIAYYTLDQSRSFSHEHIAVLLILVSILLFSYAEAKYNLHPSSLLDFNWLRVGLNSEFYRTQEILLVEYQEIGMDLTYAMAFVLGCKKLPKNWLIYMVMGVYLILMSGARQALLGFIVIFFVRMTLMSEKKSYRKILIYGVALLLLFGFISLLKNMDIDIVNSTLEEGDSERFIIWTLAFNLFINNPIWGVGLGGFPLYAIDYPWPHNFILEILCECGLYGGITLLVVTTLYLSRNKITLMHITSNNMFYFLYVFAFFVRVMVSGDLTLSIGLFSAIFAIANHQNSKVGVRI